MTHDRGKCVTDGRTDDQILTDSREMQYTLNFSDELNIHPIKSIHNMKKKNIILFLQLRANLMFAVGF